MQTLQEMSACVFIEPGMYQTLTASNVGVNPQLIAEGGKEYSFSEALNVISSLDRALKACPKYLCKRIAAQRGAFIFAFGPEMEAYIAQRL